MKTVLLGIGAAVALACTPVVAGAAGQSRVERSVEINYSDLDLTRVEGARTLHARISAAANRVCGDRDVRDPRSMRAWRECRAKAFDDAVASVNMPTLTAVHREARGEKVAIIEGSARRR